MRFVISMLIGVLSITLLVACQQENIKLQDNSDGIKRIALADAKTAFDSGRAVIVDTRPAEAYKGEHIKGSINIPDSDMANRVGELPKDKLIITYCS
jgi:3-mercaptopyruvate sulfurtransferase SseA